MGRPKFNDYARRSHRQLPTRFKQAFTAHNPERHVIKAVCGCIGAAQGELPFADHGKTCRNLIPRCERCGLVENSGVFTAECPGAPLTENQREELIAGRVNFIGGQWVRNWQRD